MAKGNRPEQSVYKIHKYFYACVMESDNKLFLSDRLLIVNDPGTNVFVLCALKYILHFYLVILYILGKKKCHVHLCAKLRTGKDSLV